MASHVYVKSQSLVELSPSKAANYLSDPQRKAYYLFNHSPPASAQHESTPVRKQSAPSASNPHYSHLEIFRNKYQQRLRNSVQLPHAREREDGRHHEDRNVYRGTVSEGKKVKKSEFRVSAGSRHSRERKDLKTVHNFFFSGKHKSSVLTPERGSEGSGGKDEQFDDGQFRKSRSIMLLRRLNRKKEKLAQHRIQRQEQQFYKKKEIPIHHTQHHFRQPNRIQTQGTSPPHQQSLAHQRTKRAIEDILKLQSALKESQQEQQIVDEVKWVKSRAIVNRVRIREEEGQGRERNGVRGGNKWKMVDGRPAKPIRRKMSRKEEEFEFGPWKRNVTGDFQGFI